MVVRWLVVIVICSIALYVVATVSLLLIRRKATELATARAAGSPISFPTMENVLDAGNGYWRGPAPDEEHYAELAEAGCGLVVDLRSEADLSKVEAAADDAGIDVLLLPTNNTRPPSRDHVAKLSAAQAAANPAVAYVHCQAGEGRTGAILGALAVRRGQPRSQAVADALSVGSLTFAQLFYVVSGARIAVLPTVIDWVIDRPTEAAFNLVSRR